MAASSKPKQVVIDALVLACSNSPLRDVVGTDALRSVLDFEWRQITASGSFDLQLVWETFESQPGFDPEVAAAPICRFKSWENQLGMTVELPRALRNLSETERAEHAERCDVSRHELQQILRRAPDPEPAGRAATDPGRVRRASSGGHPRQVRRQVRRMTSGGHSRALSGNPVPGKRRLGDGQRRMLAIAAGIVAVVTLGIAGYQVYSSFLRGPDWSGIHASEFAGALPVANATRFGDQVRATLTDDGWLARGREEREQQLAGALEQLATRGVTVLYLKDRSGAVRAIAQRFGKPPKLRYVFR